MVKRIIFDIDKTLIDFPENFEVEVSEILNKYKLNIKPIDIYKAVGTYETNGESIYYEKQRVLKVINKVLNLNLDLKFMEDFFNVYNKLINPVDEMVIDTLKYLKSKYEIYALTNWFTDSQKARLQEAGILEYFDKVYGTDIVPMKPKKESFMSVIGDLKPEECVMIGDNLDVDIKVPYEIGMKVYHLNKFGTSKYPTIKKIEELKERL